MHMAKKYYDENGNEVKRSGCGGCLKWVLIILIIIIALVLIFGGGEDSTSPENNTAQETEIEQVESSQESVDTSSVEEQPIENNESIESTFEEIESNEVESEETVEEQAEVTENPNADEQITNEIDNNAEYQRILNEYTIILQQEAPRLADEYNQEYPRNENGLEGLAELSNEKIGELAEISNEGVSEMADVHFNSGSGEYEEYEEWSGRLMDVYMEEAEVITNAYMESAM